MHIRNGNFAGELGEYIRCGGVTLVDNDRVINVRDYMYSQDLALQVPQIPWTHRRSL